MVYSSLGKNNNVISYTCLLSSADHKRFPISIRYSPIFALHRNYGDIKRESPLKFSPDVDLKKQLNEIGRAKPVKGKSKYFLTS